MADSCFTGKEDDVEVGLIYFGKRYYAPLLQRWISADPLAVHAPGEADLNLYAYVHGKVLVAVDPVGLDPPKTRSQQAKAWVSGVVHYYLDKHEAVTRTAVDPNAGVKAVGNLVTAYEREGGGPHGAAEVASQLLNPFHGAGAASRRADRAEERGDHYESGYARAEEADVLGRAFVVVVGGAAISRMGGRTPSAAPGPVSAPGAGLSPGPGNFTSADVALGLTKIGEQEGRVALSRFARSAKQGTSFAVKDPVLAPGSPTPTAQVAGQVLEQAEAHVAQSGGRIRFNLAGFELRQAFEPGTEFFHSTTSNELRMIMSNPRLRTITDFFDASGNQLTAEQVAAQAAAHGAKK